MNKSKIFVLSTISLCVLQVLIILLSWIISAIFPAHGFHSLLSDSGIRWLLSRYINNGYSDFLIWFLFCSSFIGTFIWSKLPKKIISFKSCDYNERFAIRVFFCELAIGIFICLLLALYPHSSLLGITGKLFPGPFIMGISFILGITILGGSVTFLMLSGKLKTYEDASKALLFGIKAVAPLVVIFFLLKETLEMIRFVFIN
jgi:p-aminobenzoyl-glutamate transporter AbgT